MKYMASRKRDKHSERKQYFVCVCSLEPLLRDQPGGVGILEQALSITMDKKA